MIFWTRGRRLVLAMILIFLPAISLVAGFASPDYIEARAIGVDLRRSVADQDLAKELNTFADARKFPVVAVASPCQFTNQVPCRAHEIKDLYPLVQSKATTVVYTDGEVTELLATMYGPATEFTGSNNVVEAVTVIPVTFSGGAAIATALLLIPLCGLLIASQFIGGAQRRPQPTHDRVPAQPSHERPVFRCSQDLQPGANRPEPTGSSRRPPPRYGRSSPARADQASRAHTSPSTVATSLWTMSCCGP
jgi:hypothetical protein